MASENPSGRKPRVLIVEDDRATYTALRALIAHHGCEVIVATTVADATKALARKSDFIVLDLMLPDGNGLCILEHVRREKIDTKVFITTGTHEPDRMSAVRALQPDLLLPKPIDIALLLSKLSLG